MTSAPDREARASRLGACLDRFALARAQAVDVTAVLVFGAVVTALIAKAADGAAFDPVGLILVTAGAALIALAALRRPSGRVAAP